MMDEELDDINIQILRLLQHDGRISNTELAQRVGLAPPTVLRRVKLLEERGYIKGYVALVDPLALGLTVTAFIFVETAAGCNLSETETFLAPAAGASGNSSSDRRMVFSAQGTHHQPADARAPGLPAATQSSARSPDTYDACNIIAI